jgi:hypothetical protein
MWRNILPNHLERKDLINAQQMEVAVNGPDGATHLVFCTGIANLSSCSHETFTFLVGPLLSRRQFVGAIASGALSTIQVHGNVLTETNLETEPEARLVTINAAYDEESGQVKVSAEIASSTATTKLAISYNVNILAELSIC